MGDYMMKKIFIFLFILTLILGLTACSSEPETIEGYWMAENGETISFNSDDKAIIEGLSMDYSIYNENNLSISFLGFAEEFRFDIEKDVLTLTDLNSNSVMTYYRNEEKQAEIQKNLNKIAAERAEQERIQQELEAQAQAQKEYEQYVTRLKNRIGSIDKEIPRIQGYISDKEGYIADNERYIQEKYDNINEIEKEISELQYSTGDLVQGKIEVLRGQQEVCYGTIEVHNEQIKTYNNEIIRYKQQISTFETEKEEIIKELKELGEY